MAGSQALTGIPILAGDTALEEPVPLRRIASSSPAAHPPTPTIPVSIKNKSHLDLPEREREGGREGEGGREMIGLLE